MSENKGKKIWHEIKDILYNDEDFCEIGKAFEQTGKVTIGKAGNAVCRLMKQRELVDFAKEWMGKNR